MNKPTTIQLAIQEDMLPGPSLADRFHQAAVLGLQGIEFWSQSLPDQADEIARLHGTGGVVAASVNNGMRSRFLDPDPAERTRAITELKEALTLAGRIGAAGVVFVPHFFGPLLPDLSPWMDVVTVERNLLSSQLMALAEHAREAGTGLWVEAVNRSETHLLNRLEQATSLVAPLAHPNLGIVADLFHMAAEESDLPVAIRENGQWIAHVHLADSNRKVPGLGATDFGSAIRALKEIQYAGWMALECGEPGANLGHAGDYMRELESSLGPIKDLIADSPG